MSDDPKLAEFRDRNIALLKEVEELKAKYDGIDPAAVAVERARLAELEKAKPDARIAELEAALATEKTARTAAQAIADASVSCWTWWRVRFSARSSLKSCCRWSTKARRTTSRGSRLTRRASREVEKLVGSIAMGQAPASIVAAIRERELEIGRPEVRLRSPRQPPNIERLREALTQRAVEWRATLREEPKVARMLLRRLIGPLVLHDESTRPDFVKADAVVKTGLMDGLAEIQHVASPEGFEPSLPA